MKRILAAILVSALLLALLPAACAEEEFLEYGPFSYDLAGSVDCRVTTPTNTIIEYSDHVVMLHYIPLADEGIDQEVFDVVLESPSADSSGVAELFLEGLYMEPADDLYQDFAIDYTPSNYYTENSILYTGVFTDSGDSYPMAGACLVDAEGLLLVEALSLTDADAAVGFRKDALDLISNEGRPVFARLADETVYMGSFTYDLSGCDEFSLDGSYLIAEYGTRTVCVEHAYFPAFGATFEKISRVLDASTCRAMAKLLFTLSDYVDYDNTIYKFCRIDETEITTFPEGIMFSGMLDDEYGNRRVSGFILVTEDEVIFQHTIDYELGASIASTESFRLKTLNRLRFEGEPVLK